MNLKKIFNFATGSIFSLLLSSTSLSADTPYDSHYYNDYDHHGGYYHDDGYYDGYSNDYGYGYGGDFSYDDCCNSCLSSCCGCGGAAIGAIVAGVVGYSLADHKHHNNDCRSGGGGTFLSDVSGTELEFQLTLQFQTAGPSDLVITPFVVLPNGLRITQASYSPTIVAPTDQDRFFNFTPPLIGEYAIGFEISNPSESTVEILSLVFATGTRISGTLEIAAPGTPITLIPGDSEVVFTYNYQIP